MKSDDDDKPDSLLTTRFRDYLDLQPENNNYVRDVRTKMRDRIRVGLSDFIYLNQHAKETDINQIFERGHNIPEAVKELKGSNSSLPDHYVSVRHMIQFAYRGIRANGMTPDEFVTKIVERSIQKGEAIYRDVDQSQVECNLSLELEIHEESDVVDMDPVMKLQRGLSLTPEDYQEIMDRLSNHLDKDEIVGKNIPQLVDAHLVEDNK